MSNRPIYLIVHHTGGSNANPLQDSSNFTFKMCNDLHRVTFNMLSSLGYWVGYHYYIEKDGKVYQARSDNEEGAHARGYNSHSLGICLAGNFDATDPTEAQKVALKALLLQKTAQYSIPATNVLPHRRFASKTCYGKRLPDTWAQDLMHSLPTKDATLVLTILKDLNAAMDQKNYKKARDNASYLFGELSKLI